MIISDAYVKKLLTVIGVVVVVVVIIIVIGVGDFLHIRKTTATIKPPDNGEYDCYPVSEKYSVGNSEKTFQTGFVCPVYIDFEDSNGKYTDVMLSRPHIFDKLEVDESGEDIEIYYYATDPEKTALVRTIPFPIIKFGKTVIIVVVLTILISALMVYVNRKKIKEIK